MRDAILVVDRRADAGFEFCGSGRSMLRSYGALHDRSRACLPADRLNTPALHLNLRHEANAKTEPGAECKFLASGKLIGGRRHPSNYRDGARVGCIILAKLLGGPHEEKPGRAIGNTNRSRLATESCDHRRAYSATVNATYQPAATEWIFAVWPAINGAGARQPAAAVRTTNCSTADSHAATRANFALCADSPAIGAATSCVADFEAG